MKHWVSMVVSGIALIALAGCDDRPTEPAIVVPAEGQIAFGGDEKACLTQAYVRNQDASEDDEAYVWMVSASDGGCLRFPLVFGIEPDGAGEMTGSAQLKPNTRYDFEAGTAERRYVAEFEPAASNGIFYVRDRAGQWTDVRRAQQ